MKLQNGKEIKIIKLLLISKIYWRQKKEFQRQYRIMRESEKLEAQEAQSIDWRSPFQRSLDMCAEYG